MGILTGRKEGMKEGEMVRMVFGICGETRLGRHWNDIVMI